MSHYDDDNDDFEESEDTDAVIRELRTEIVRLESELDQIHASLRERMAQITALRADIASLELHLAHVEARRKRDARLILIASVLMLLSLATLLVTYLIRRPPI